MEKKIIKEDGVFRVLEYIDPSCPTTTNFEVQTKCTCCDKWTKVDEVSFFKGELKEDTDILATINELMRTTLSGEVER